MIFAHGVLCTLYSVRVRAVVDNNPDTIASSFVTGLCTFHAEPSYCALDLLPHLPLQTLSKLSKPACMPFCVAYLLRTPSSSTGSRANQSSPNLWWLSTGWLRLLVRLLTALSLITFFIKIKRVAVVQWRVRCNAFKCYFVQCTLTVARISES